MATKVEVCGHRVLIKPWFPEEATEWGFKLDVGNLHKREQAATQEGRIVDIGPNAWLAFDDGKPWAKVGDMVMFAKYAGKFLKIDDEDYVIVSDEDVQCILHDDERFGSELNEC